GEVAELNEVDVKKALLTAMQTMRVKDAATAVAGATGMARRDVYQLALGLKDET
ncbi:MAG: rRNA (cytidine-2'-O-)-methyltransferase, partial [Octadecabacter sp.]|nr:rRNA (cytidine-2'-O-)-methyltransferase [Octadecabacter sp.]